VGVTKSAVRVPMKKLFAVATLVGAASGTAVAVSSNESKIAPVANRVIVDIVEVEPVASSPPIENVVVDQIAIKPLALGNGWPACGNVVNKAGYSSRQLPCPTTAEQTVDVVLDTMLIGVRASR
jgi:hypothetical protein